MPKFHMLAVSALALSVAPVVAAQQAEADKVYLEADVLIDNQQNQEMIAEGNVVARYGDRQLSADRVIYSLDTKKVRAIGNVRIQDPDGTVRFSDEIEVDDTLGSGVAAEFSAQLPDNALVAARTATRTENGSNMLERAIYTACDVCEENDYTPTWSLRARKAVQNAETGMISYQDTVFELKGVPIFYMPYFAHPDPTLERKSGFLFPKPGSSSKLGFVYEQPYYWAISPSQDVIVEPRIHTKVNPTLGLEYRKRFWSGSLTADLSLAYDYEFDSNGDRIQYDQNYNVVEEPENFTGPLIPSEESLRSHIFAEGGFIINEDWRWGFSAERVTDDLYLRRYDISGENEKRGLYDTEQKRLLSQIYAVRQTKSSYFDVATFSVQGLRPGDDDDEFGVVTPLAFAEQNLDFGKYGLVTFQGLTSILNRAEGDDTRRVTASAQWENSYVAPAGLIFEPQAKLRTDYYDYYLEGTGTTDTVEDRTTRNVGMVAATARWPLINRTSFANIYVEPIAMVAYSESSVENGTLPNEDSTFYEYTLDMAFEPDPFATSDLIETGTRLAAGVRSRADFNNNLSLNGVVARRWKSEDDDSFSRASNLSQTESDYLVGGGLSFGNVFSIESNFRLDEDFTLQRTELRSSLEYWRLKAGVTYFELSDDLSDSQIRNIGSEGIQIQGAFDVTKNIKLMYSQIRNIETQERRREAIGVEFYDDCGFIRLTWSESDISDRGVGDSGSLKIAFGLRTLGNLAGDQFD